MKNMRFFVFGVRILLCCFLFIALSGCDALRSPTVIGGTPPPTKPLVKPGDPVSEAESAFARGDYTKAELIGQRLAGDATLSPQQRERIFTIYATAAARNRHPLVSLKVLDQWKATSASVDATQAWQDIWCEAVGQLSSREARTIANQVYQDSGRSPDIRSVAGVVFAVRQWEDGDIGQSIESLESLYRAVPNQNLRVLLERRLSSQLHVVSPRASSLAVTAVTAENRAEYPYNIILIDQLLRQKKMGTNAAQATQQLGELAAEVRLADRSLLKGPPTAPQQPTAPVPTTGDYKPSASGKSVVLALPVSGAHGVVSTKIIEGAQAACYEMSATLTVIDTDSSDWVSRIESLPAGVVAIGGPMRGNDYTLAKSRGLTSKRAFFVFMPSLEGEDEGRVAWRFFSSPQDQVNTLTNFSSSLGVRNYGVLYPDDQYGRRMSDIFEERVRGTGFSVVTSLGYTPRIPDSWMQQAGDFLSYNKTATSSPFQATFLPDSWKSTEVLISSIAQFGEGRQILLGTSLWEQGLEGHPPFSNPDLYKLAVFPGGWNPVSPSPLGRQLQGAMQQRGKKADYWSGLGYDFARMSMSINAQEGWTSGSINSSLQSLSIGWSLAPIRWDATGRANQDLFLFTPSNEGTGGFTPVDTSVFRQTLSEAWQQ